MVKCLFGLLFSILRTSSVGEGGWEGMGVKTYSGVNAEMRSSLSKHYTWEVALSCSCRLKLTSATRKFEQKEAKF